MGAFGLFLLLWMVPCVSSIWCYACVDKTIEYNPDLVPLLKIPPGLPNCSPGRSPKPDSEFPSFLWVVRCSDPCLSLDWKRNGHVTDRLRFCSTNLVKEEDFINKTLKIGKIARYPGLENHLKFCDGELCNDSDELDIRNATLLEDNTTESLAMSQFPAVTDSPTTDLPSTTKVHVTINPFLIKPKYGFHLPKPRSSDAVSQNVGIIIMIILSYI